MFKLWLLFDSHKMFSHKNQQIIRGIPIYCVCYRHEAKRACCNQASWQIFIKPGGTVSSDCWQVGYVLPGIFFEIVNR